MDVKKLKELADLVENIVKDVRSNVFGIILTTVFTVIGYILLMLGLVSWENRDLIVPIIINKLKNETDLTQYYLNRLTEFESLRKENLTLDYEKVAKLTILAKELSDTLVSDRVTISVFNNVNRHIVTSYTQPYAKPIDKSFYILPVNLAVYTSIIDDIINNSCSIETIDDVTPQVRLLYQEYSVHTIYRCPVNSYAYIGVDFRDSPNKEVESVIRQYGKQIDAVLRGED